MRPFFASHARTSHVQISMRTFILKWSHFATARTSFWVKIKFWGHFLYEQACRKYGSYFSLKCIVTEIWFFFSSFELLNSLKHVLVKNECTQKQYMNNLWLFSSKIRNIYSFSLKSGQNVWCMTSLKMFARTFATHPLVKVKFNRKRCPIWLHWKSS